jgi:hypothetical protein
MSTAKLRKALATWRRDRGNKAYAGSSKRSGQWGLRPIVLMVKGRRA